MPSQSLLERPLGELARQLPGAIAVFHAHALDFCCGGKQSLGQALAARPADSAAVLAALEQLLRPAAAEPDWRAAPAGALIEHLLSRYHARHREQLPELIRLAARVEAVHGDRAECPHGLAAHLRQMQAELESHMQKEEQILFPLLAQGLPAAALPPVAVMRHEHEQHGLALARMMELAHQLEQPQGACNTWRALLAGLHSLHQDLLEHIRLENEILFA
ncbi:regulator of cell morphogenesis and NO signaling [Inhella inkyongensis]|uniref:Regulator of cell morphogenesis and NO signaling n=1 Tax=Inhella inkyongensis TaxID=392593 RepID=A0A840S998_9BURK|nr:iron-sulfur cluster repair protein YtfE [Inhella inkyongensis]MBB5204989.1 regulator of cell morphogenesis and NO signaling [Inhella inkyongensis]